MALTVTPGYSHASGGLVTPTRLNTAISGLTVNMAEKKLLATTTAGAATEVAYTTAGLAMMQAADVPAQQTILGINEQRARVSTQFDKTADTTLANVTGLTVDVEAGQTYSFEAVLYVTQDTQPAVGKTKIAISGTATAAAFIMSAIEQSSSSYARARPTALATSVNGNSIEQAIEWIVCGTIATTDAGTLTVQFAQRTASGTCSVLVGSWLKVWGY